MSSLMLSSLPSPQQQIESLQRDLYQRNRQLNEIEEELRLEKLKSAQIEVGVRQLRSVLNPLYQALQMIYGEADTMGISGEAASQSNSRITAVWEDWKRKLGGQPAKAIDALLLHGAMTQTQLRIHIGCANGSIAGIVYQLNKASLINKIGGKISLKELQ